MNIVMHPQKHLIMHVMNIHTHGYGFVIHNHLNCLNDAGKILRQEYDFISAL